MPIAIRSRVIVGVALLGSLFLLTFSTALAAVINVPAGGNFQAALNSANPGDTIVLQAGAVYTGSFELPVKPGAEFITIQSSALGSLPPAGTRVNPSHAPLMPRLVNGGGGPVISALNNSHHYRFIGLEMKPSDGASSNDVVLLGLTVELTNPSQFPHDMEVDRCYIHGEVEVGSKRGVTLNGIEMTVKNSHISEFHLINQDRLCGARI